MEMLRSNTMEMEIRKLCRRFGIVYNAMNMNNYTASASRNTGHMQLFEVKRRFRSVVELSYMRKGKILANNNDHDHSSSNTSSTGSSSSAQEGHHLPIDEDEGKLQTTSNATDEENQPRNVIYEETFVLATSEHNDDLSHGGFLTPSLAKLVFQAGCATIRKNRDQSARKEIEAFVTSQKYNSLNERDIENDSSAMDKSEKYWTVYDVLSFGCNGVRGDMIDEGLENGTLLRFVFSMFLLLPRTNNQAIGDVPRFVSIPSLRKLDNGANKDWSMTRQQVGHMLLLVMDHANHRLISDSPPKNSGENAQNSENILANKLEKLLNDQNLEDIKIDAEVANAVGFLPPNFKTSSSKSNVTKVSLTSLIDYVFQDGLGNKSEKNSSSERLSFRGFVKWCTNTNAFINDQDFNANHFRLGLLLVDLRLVASTLFGVQPSSPKMEQILIDEIFLRYNYRFPPSDLSKRGPVDTVWYVIPSIWWRKWDRYVRSGIDSNGRPFVLPPIDNDKLLVDNGSLALRSGLRNKQDFEVRTCHNYLLSFTYCHRINKSFLRKIVCTTSCLECFASLA
jgi:hypothetical protein